MPSTTTASIQELFTPVLAPLEQVKASLLEIVPPDSMILAQTVQKSLTSGGKYLRPVATLLAGQAIQADMPEQSRHALVEVAAVTEIIHIATLLHDDVLDESDLRRGKQTVRATLGNKISVLSGDYLLAQASLKLSKLGNTRLVSIFAQVLADLCDGEVEQLHASFSLDASWDTYYRKTICKTATLFSAGCESAGVIQGLPEAQIQSLRAYGRSFGIAFQIVDDLLDYTATEAELGKPVLDDLRNGLLNAPVLLALESEQLTPEERTALRQAVQQLFDLPQQAEQPAVAAKIAETVETIQNYLTQARAIEATRALAEDYIQQAKQAIGFLPPSTEKDALNGLVEYISHRRS